MDNLKWDLRYIELAELVSTWSKDPSTQTGAVIVDSSNRVVSVGFNGFPRGVADDDRLFDRPTKYEMIVHCEVNAILFAHRDLTGCTLYTYPFQSCSRCASVVIQSGIKRCVAPVNKEERWQESFKLAQDMFKDAGVTLETIEWVSA